jgi:hypothetical protein
LAIATKISNAGQADKEIQVWLCSYPDYWKSDNDAVTFRHGFAHEFLLKDPPIVWSNEVTVKITEH